MMASFPAFSQDGRQVQTVIYYKDQPVKVDGKYLLTHTVQPKETLYSISKRYNVTVADLITLNPSLAAGLKANSVIFVKILDDPAQMTGKSKVSVDNNDTETNAKKTSAKEYNKKAADTNGTIKKTGQTEHKASKNADDAFWNEFYGVGTEIVAAPEKVNSINMGIILPIHASDTLRFNRNYYDFYAGALIAAKEIKAEDKDLVLNFYDQFDYPSMASLENAKGFAENNIIIGPVRKQSLSEILSYASSRGIVLVSPMDQTSESLVGSYEKFVQVPPVEKYQSKNMYKTLLEEYYRDRSQKVLLIYERNGKDAAAVGEAVKMMDSLGIRHNEVAYDILEGRNILPKIISFMNKDAEQNIVLVPSNNEAFVSDVLRNLLLSTKQEFKVTLFGLPKWKNFETINAELFHKVNLHLSLPYFVNYDNEQVKKFVMQFRALFKGEPTPFAFQGYDIVKYFADAIYNGGTKNFIKYLPKAKMLQVDFNFVNERGRGFENAAMRNIIYRPDFSIEIR